MTFRTAQERWRALQAGPVDPPAYAHLARQVGLSFLDQCLYSNTYEAAYLGLLCEMATTSPDAKLCREAAAALFGIVVEGLCDDFEDLQTGIYERVIAQVVSFCRRLPAGQALDRRLRGFGLLEEQDLLGRAAALRQGPGAPIALPVQPERLLFLSRVTIGADVAITSVLLQRFGDAFPRAELVVLGSRNLAGLLGGHPRLRVREVGYARGGGLMERFDAWQSVLDAVDAEETPSRAAVVVDSDSRLTQLGVLPVVAPERYLFFNSRVDAAAASMLPMAQLANRWCDRVLGAGSAALPALWLQEPTRTRARRLVGGLREQGCRQVITLNFGVGGNPRKRLDDGFESGLVLRLLAEPGTLVLLDQGSGTEELGRTDRLLDRIRGAGWPTALASLDDTPPRVGSQGVVRVASRIDEIAALIAESDEFIGYDSACQHIAAAVGVPGCTLFAGSNNPRFVRRWHACGPGRSEVVHVDTVTQPRMFDDEDILSRLLHTRDRR